MSIGYYIDADLLGLAKLLVAVRTDVTYAGDPGGIGIDGKARSACAILPSAKDVEWIPVVASAEWIVISRDRHLQSRPSELAAIKGSRIKVITLDGRKQLNRWLQLEIVVSQWRDIEALRPLPGPWVYVASRTGLRKAI